MSIMHGTMKDYSGNVKRRQIIVCFSVFVIVLILIFLPHSGCAEPEPPNRFIQLLELLPYDADSYGGFYLVDYEKIWELTGISMTGPDNQPITTEEFGEHLISLINTDDQAISDAAFFIGSYYTGYDIYMWSSPIQDQYVGYSFTDVHAEINNLDQRQLGTDQQPEIPPERLVAAIGNFDPEATEKAMNNRIEWPQWAADNYTAEVFHDIKIHSWYGGSEPHGDFMFSPPNLDILGRAMPFAVSDNRLFVAPSPERVKSMIDTSLGISDSLADIPEYARIATALHELDAVAAILLPEYWVIVLADLKWYTVKWEFNQILQSQDSSLVPESYESRDFIPGPLLKRPVAIGTGLGRDEKGVYAALVILHNNSDDALDNVSLLQQRIETGDSINTGRAWNKIITDIEISTDNELLLAKLYTDNPYIWSSWYLYNDSLLLCE